MTANDHKVCACSSVHAQWSTAENSLRNIYNCGRIRHSHLPSKEIHDKFNQNSFKIVAHKSDH